MYIIPTKVSVSQSILFLSKVFEHPLIAKPCNFTENDFFFPLPKISLKANYCDPSKYDRKTTWMESVFQILKRAN